MITYEDIERVNKEIRTTDIKGKEYAEVNQRIKAFRMIYPQGSIPTEIVSIENGVVIMKASVLTDDGKLLATGTAYEKENSTFINKTSYIENCETSAVGRALGMAGFGIDTSIASAEEVRNAINNQTITPEEAKEYKITFGKHSGKTLIEINDEAPDYIEWLVKNSKDDNILKCIEILFGMKKADYEVDDDTLILTTEITQLITETGVDIEKIKEKYDIKSISEATKEQLKEIKETLEKHKTLMEKVKKDE